MRISIFGMGYLGAVVAACVAEQGHDVIAVDTDVNKVNAVNAGRSPVSESGLADLIARNAGRLRATTSYEDAVRNSDLSFICVGTPGLEDGSADLSAVQSVCMRLGAEMEKKSGWHGVVLRSTVPVGTSRNIAVPLLEEYSGRKAGIDFGFAFNPEFLREGTAVKDYFNPSLFVIGALDALTSEMLLTLYADINVDEKTVDTLENAEGVKCTKNAWHATKIVFANDIGNAMKAQGADGHRVMEILCKDKTPNAYLQPGFAYGGSCLPKDTRALVAAAWKKGVEMPLLSAVLTANDKQVQIAREMLRKSGKRKVGLMGLAFKPGTDDLRESPLVTLADMMIEDGQQLVIYDPAICRTRLPARLSDCLVDTPEALTAESEILVVGHKTADFTRILRSNDNLPVIDLVRLKDGTEKRAGYQGICW